MAARGGERVVCGDVNRNAIGCARRTKTFEREVPTSPNMPVATPDLITPWHDIGKDRDKRIEELRERCKYLEKELEEEWKTGNLDEH